LFCTQDGIEAVRHYREFERAESLKNPQDDSPPRMLVIIGMSANSDNRTKQSALDAGMNYFMSKPFNLKELRPIIRQFHLSLD
jgi:CheY-like chemotaxis protein